MCGRVLIKFRNVTRNPFVIMGSIICILNYFAKEFRNTFLATANSEYYNKLIVFNTLHLTQNYILIYSLAWLKTLPFQKLELELVLFL